MCITDFCLKDNLYKLIFKRQKHIFIKGIDELSK